MNFSQLDAKTPHVQVRKTQSAAELLEMKIKTIHLQGAFWEGAYSST